MLQLLASVSLLILLIFDRCTLIVRFPFGHVIVYAKRKYEKHLRYSST